MNVDPPLLAIDQSTLEDLTSRVNPLEPCDDFGISFYIQCVRILSIA